MDTSSGLKLEYSWEDLRPVHPLFITTLIAQALGAALSLYMLGLANWFDTAWQGGALATFPGFLLGLAVQSHLRPGSISENRSIVLFMGLIALGLLAVALFMPPIHGSAA
jgi:hypothetical protein